MQRPPRVLDRNGLPTARATAPTANRVDLRPRQARPAYRDRVGADAAEFVLHRVVARPEPLARLGAIAALTHERMDGSGYHRGLSGPAIPATARVLAAADIYRAMTEPRPHRPATTGKAAAPALRAEVRAGRIAPDAADAVLAAAGAPRQRRQTGPAGLTPRELEVLVLIASGASTGQVARTLGISSKTAGTHTRARRMGRGSRGRSRANGPPLAERHTHFQQVVAGVGQPVVVTAFVRLGCRLDDAEPFELSESLRKQGAGQAGGTVQDLAEGLAAQIQVADDQRGPPLCEDLRPAGDRTVLSIGPHDCSVTGLPLAVKSRFFTS